MVQSIILSKLHVVNKRCITATISRIIAIHSKARNPERATLTLHNMLIAPYIVNIINHIIGVCRINILLNELFDFASDLHAVIKQISAYTIKIIAVKSIAAYALGFLPRENIRYIRGLISNKIPHAPLDFANSIYSFRCFINMCIH